MSRTLNASALAFCLVLILDQAGRSEIIPPMPGAGDFFVVENVADATCTPDASACSSCAGGRDRCNQGGRPRRGHVQMPPHYPYFPPMHGYYYFRPYNASMLRPQQATAVTWGVDPRTPYDNQLFQQVYAEAEAAQP